MSNHDASFRRSSRILCHATFVNFMPLIESIHEQQRKEERQPSSNVKVCREVKVRIPKRVRQYVKILDFEILLILEKLKQYFKRRKKANSVIKIRSGYSSAK